jgi:hypothetical protein
MLLEEAPVPAAADAELTASDGEGEEGEVAPPAAAISTAAARGGGGDAASAAALRRASSGRWRSRRLAALAAASRVKRALEAQTVGSTYLAGAFLVATSWLNALRRRLARGVAADTGLGTRRVLAIVVAGAALIMLPVAVLHSLFDSGDGGGSAAEAARAPGMLHFLLAAVAYGAVVCIFSDIAVELPLLSSVFGGGKVGAGAGAGVGAGAGAGATPETPRPAAPAAAVLAAQDAAAVRCLSLLVAYGLGAALCAALGAPYAGQVTVLGLAAAGLLYVPAAISASGLDATRALGTLKKRLGGGAGEAAAVPAAAAAAAGAPAQLAALLASWFVDLSGLLAVVGHAAGLLSDGGGGDDGGKAALPRYSSYGAGAGAGAGADRRTLAGRAQHVFAHVWSDPDSRKIFMFLSINVRGRARARAAAAAAAAAAAFPLLPRAGAPALRLPLARRRRPPALPRARSSSSCLSRSRWGC